MAQRATNDIDQGNRRYVSAIMKAPVLERDVEFELARRWRDNDDEVALHQLIEAYARFVVRIAWKYRGYRLPIGDLIQEGNIGLMEAAKRFDPDRDVRFSTYASWWIMASIQDYVLRHSSIVRVATTPAHRRLFFNLRRVRSQIATGENGELTASDRERVAEHLDVKLADVERMEGHLSGVDSSLNAPVGSDEDAEFQDLLADDAPSPEHVAIHNVDTDRRSRWLGSALDTLSERERRIIVSRFLEEDRQTLSEIGADFGVSKERIRQLEARALGKLRTALRGYSPDRRDHVDIGPQD